MSPAATSAEAGEVRDGLELHRGRLGWVRSDSLGPFVVGCSIHSIP